MPRKARVEFPGAVYHLLDRSDRREPVVQNGALNANGTVSAAYNLSIVYDANGNRVDAFDGNNAHYNSILNNQYSGDWTGGLSCDDNANLTARAGWSYGYDAQNRLLSIDSGSTHLRYHYDPLNRIVAREKNGTVTTQVWQKGKGVSNCLRLQGQSWDISGGGWRGR